MIRTADRPGETDREIKLRRSNDFALTGVCPMGPRNRTSPSAWRPPLPRRTAVTRPRVGSRALHSRCAIGSGTAWRTRPANAPAACLRRRRLALHAAPTRKALATLVITAIVVVVIALIFVGVGVGTELGEHYQPGSGRPSPRLDIAAIVVRVEPAVVAITTTLAQGGESVGTGMVLTSSGLVLTNSHVIENATTVSAQIGSTGRTYAASVLGYSITDDVALLQLEGATGTRTITAASLPTLSGGQWVLAIGNAGGRGGTPTAVSGTITALDRTIMAQGQGLLSATLHGMIQFTAATQPGDSGAPVVDASGRVIGMNTAASVMRGSATGVRAGANQGYAIGIDQALSIVNLIKYGQASSLVHIGPPACAVSSNPTPNPSRSA